MKTDKSAEDKVNSRDFYELMQEYRFSPIDNQERTVKAFEAVKQWIMQEYRTTGMPSEDEIFYEVFDILNTDIDLEHPRISAIDKADLITKWVLKLWKGETK